MTILQDEIEARVAAMRDSDDDADLSDDDRVRAALEDILELDADEHVAAASEHAAAFKRSWRRMQNEARKRLAAMPVRPCTINYCGRPECPHHER
jgi:hypothetical protein